MELELVSLITPVRDRQLTFANCERLVYRAMNYCFKQGMRDISFEWIVADDGREPVQCTMGQQHLKLPASDVSPLESFKTNLIACMQQAQGDVIFIIEDDDWKSERYFYRILQAFLQSEIAGEGLDRLVGMAPATYYNPVLKVGQWLGNREHASLSETAIGGSELGDKFCDVIKSAQSFEIDKMLWTQTPADKRTLLVNDGAQDALGIKGLVAHPLADGHNGELYARSYRATWGDPNGDILKGLIGVEDADVYLGLAELIRQQLQNQKKESEHESITN